MPDKPHQKHARLTRPNLGEFGRNELAILGAPCKNICELAGHLISRLTVNHNVAFVDAMHKAPEPNPDETIEDGACLQFTDKITYREITFPEALDVFEKHAVFYSQDLILVNGNHYTAKQQIIIIDPRKPLEKKLDKLTDVVLILMQENEVLPNYLEFLAEKNTPILYLQNMDAIVGFIDDFLQKKNAPLNGLALIGGQSSRMGRDKSAIDYNGTPQANHVFDLLNALCTETYLSCNARQKAHFEDDFPVIEDAFLGLGPMGGILSAMQKNPNAAWLTVACDLPFLTLQTLQHLQQHRNPKSMATAFLDPKGEFPEPLVTIWEPKSYPLLLRFLSQGYSCPRKALINSDVTLLHAPDGLQLTNANSPEDYRAAIEHISNPSTHV